MDIKTAKNLFYYSCLLSASIAFNCLFIFFINSLVIKTNFSILKFNLTNKFVRSITELYLRADKKSIKKIQDNVLLIKQQANVGDYLLMFENMINKWTSVGNRISLQNRTK